MLCRPWAARVVLRALQGAHSQAAARPAVAGVVPGQGTGNLGHREGAPSVRVPQEPAGPHRHTLLLCHQAGPAALPAVLRLDGESVVHPPPGALQCEPFLPLFSGDTMPLDDVQAEASIAPLGAG